MKQDIDPGKLSILYDAAKTYYSLYVSDVDLSDKDENRWIYTLVDAYLFMESYKKEHKKAPLSDNKIGLLKAHLSQLKK